MFEFSSIYSVARSGKVLGDFSKKKILAGLRDGTFRQSDDFWDPKNPKEGWQKLSSFFPDEQTAGTLEVPSKGFRFTIGGPIIVLGILMFLNGFLGNPEGSAIRQAVLQHMQTNGLLVVLIGAVLGKE